MGEKATLDGAVTLLPLEPSQVESFLEARNQSALWSALTADANLFELVRTPLLLTLLSMAIGEQVITQALDTSQITVSTIFDFYIKQRFAHEAIKRTLPFDEQRTRTLLGRFAASMWQYNWSPATELKVSYIEKDIGEQGPEFVQFMRSMHFMWMNSDQTVVQFIHLKFRDYCALPALVEALKDADMFVRWRAANTLKEIGVVAVLVLSQALKDGDHNVRWRAADALKEIGVAAVPVLSQALKDSDHNVRWRAADALEMIGDATAVPPLIEALKDADDNVRRSAAYALKTIGDATAAPALIEALKDTDLIVCWAATSALGEIGDVEVPALIEALKDADDNVRWRAAYALGEIGDVVAAPALQKALQDTDDNVRWRIAEALEKMRRLGGEKGES